MLLLQCAPINHDLLWPVIGLLFTQVCCIWASRVRRISDMESGLDLTFEKDSEFNQGVGLSHIILEPTLEHLMHQVVGVGDTKTGGIIPK